MYSKDNFIPKILPKIKGLTQNKKIIFTTYKRNRSVTIYKLEADTFLFIQKGYEQKNYEVKIDKLEKKLKQILKKEFPRSHKIRVYLIDAEQEILDNLKKL